jgi:MFS family permease
MIIRIVHLIKTVFFTALKSLSFLCEGYKNIAVYGKQKMLRHTVSLGMFYAVEMMNYQLPNIIMNSMSSDNEPILDHYERDILSLYLHIGMFLGAIIFSKRILHYPNKVNRYLNWSLKIHAFGAVLTAIVFKIFYINRIGMLGGIDPVHFLGIARGIFGFGFAAGLGLAITLVVENFPRSMRTWAATIIGMIGFIGPGIGSLLNWAINGKFIVLLIGGLLSFIVLLFPFPKDSELRKTNELQHVKLSFVSGEALKLLGICSLMGVSVQFFSEMVSWLPRVSKVWQHDWAFALRYAGFIVGTLIAGTLSKYLSQRRKIIFGFIFCQSVIVIIASFLQAWYKWYSFNNNDGHQMLTGIIYFSLGLVCGSWIITILQAAEQFSVRERPAMIILIPNFYRAGTIVIIGLNLFYNDCSDTLLMISDNDQVHPWFEQFPLVLFVFWFVFIGASLAASVFLKDNFEGDAYVADYNKEKSLEIAGRDIRGRLKDIGDDIWASNDERPILTEANEMLSDHLKTCLEGHYVLSTTFYSEENRRLLEYVGFGKEEGKFDRNTCKRYEIGAMEKDYNPTRHHSIVHDLIREGACSSIALWMAARPYLAGVLVYYSGWRERVIKDDLDYYQTFDLADIKLDQVDIQKYIPIIRNGLSIKSKVVLLEEYYSKYGDTFEASFLAFIDTYGKKEPREDEAWAIGCKKTLMLHRLDATDYGASNYYNYYINPYYGNEEQFKVTLVLKTVIQLQKSSLGQIRDLLSFIILLRSNKRYKYSAEQFFRDEDHATRENLKEIQENLKRFQIWYSRSQKLRNQYTDFKWNKLDEIQQSLSNSQILVDKMYALRTLNTALVRYLGGATREEIEKKGLPSPQSVYLKKMIDEIVEQKTKTTNNTSFGSEAVTRAKLKVVNANIPPDIKINVIDIALNIILDELIRNALFYAREENPHINIRWISRLNDDEHYELHIQNNVKSTFTDNHADTLKRMINEKIFDSTGRTGIATLHRILRFPLLGESGKLWDMKCTYIDEMVDIYIIIPKTDIENG